MIRRIEALNFRCLRHVSVELGAFHVLVGPNASGKSSFLDVIAFLGRLVSDGLDAAVEERTQNFYDLVWGRKNNWLELAVEAEIPEDQRKNQSDAHCDVIRYEVAIGIGQEHDDLAIFDEQLSVGKSRLIEQNRTVTQRRDVPATLFLGVDSSGWTSLARKTKSQGDFRQISHIDLSRNAPARHKVSPTAQTIPSSVPSKKERSLLLELAGLQIPPTTWFPAITWLANEISEAIHHLDLNSRKLRSASPPGKGGFLAPDGSNLPRVIADLQVHAADNYADWIEHLKTALPHLQGIRVVERPEDKHRYIMLQHQGGLEIPSWMLSDGTLRLLALTVLPYIPGAKPLCLIEEPENSIHPLNIETIMQSLESVYDGQVLVATHSPTVLAVTRPADILVFSRDEQRGTRIVRGSDHPGLKDWRGEVSMGTLFAGGVLG